MSGLLVSCEHHAVYKGYHYCFSLPTGHLNTGYLNLFHTFFLWIGRFLQNFAALFWVMEVFIEQRIESPSLVSLRINITLKIMSPPFSRRSFPKLKFTLEKIIKNNLLL